ncbi:MAG: hypothetical protein QXJ58_06680 [Archaeoglobaceae archaeon]
MQELPLAVRRLFISLKLLEESLQEKNTKEIETGLQSLLSALEEINKLLDEDKPHLNSSRR